MTDKCNFLGNLCRKRKSVRNGSRSEVRSAFAGRELNEARKTKWERRLSRKMRCASRAKDSFVETFFSARFLERASERAMANGRGERRKNNGERVGIGPRERSFRSKGAFSFLRFASGSGFIGFPAISWVSSSHAAMPREASGPWRTHTHRSFAQFYPGEKISMRKPEA